MLCTNQSDSNQRAEKQNYDLHLAYLLRACYGGVTAKEFCQVRCSHSKLKPNSVAVEETPEESRNTSIGAKSSINT